MFPPNTLWLPPTATKGYTRGSVLSGVVGARAPTAPRGDLGTAVMTRDGRVAVGSRHPPARGQGVAIDIEDCDGTRTNAHEPTIGRRLSKGPELRQWCGRRRWLYGEKTGKKVN